MFRNLFRSLTASRPQTKARRQVQTARPRLEVLENRLAPSNFALQAGQGSHNHIFQDGNHNAAIQVHQGSFNNEVQIGHGNLAVQAGQGHGNTIVQVGHHDVAIQTHQGSHNSIVQVP